MSFILSSSEVGAIELARYQAMLDEAAWKMPEGRQYHTADVTGRVPGVKRAFFLRLPPGGAIHKHVDADDCNTDHVVMTTNMACINYWDGGEAHMEQGLRYTVDRSIPHWAVNNGGSERVHLLVEY